MNKTVTVDARSFDEIISGTLLLEDKVEALRSDIDEMPPEWSPESIGHIHSSLERIKNGLDEQYGHCVEITGGSKAYAIRVNTRIRNLLTEPKERE